MRKQTGELRKRQWRDAERSGLTIKGRQATFSVPAFPWYAQRSGNQSSRVYFRNFLRTVSRPTNPEPRSQRAPGIGTCGMGLMAIS